MGRKPIPPEKLKVHLTIALRQETIDRLRKVDKYNVLLQKLIDDYFEKNP
jgi:hypothetical protein